MKKHNDGYVLPFVLVVLVVVCLVAVSLMSNSLSNLQRQQASIERMQDKYAAMGMIEKIEGTTATASGCTSESCICASGLQGRAINDLKEKLTTSGVIVKHIDSSGVTVVSSYGKASVEATFGVALDTSCSCATGTCTCKDENGTVSYTCRATATVGECTSYTISTEEVTE